MYFLHLLFYFCGRGGRCAGYGAASRGDRIGLSARAGRQKRNTEQKNESKHGTNCFSVSHGKASFLCTDRTAVQFLRAAVPFLGQSVISEFDFVKFNRIFSAAACSQQVGIGELQNFNFGNRVNLLRFHIAILLYG